MQKEPTELFCAYQQARVPLSESYRTSIGTSIVGWEVLIYYLGKKWQIEQKYYCMN